MGQINLNNFKVITDKLNTFFVDNKFMVASEIPTTGEFKVGDIIINNGPTNVDEPMWICVEAGNPGTWTVFNSGGGSAGGGRLSTARNRVVLNGESKSEVSIGVSGFNKASDVLMVFINSRFMTEGVDYEINADSTKIVAIGEVWNEELTSEFEIEMIVFKMMNVNENGEVVVSSANEIVKLKNTVVVNEAVNEVEIGIDGFNEGDDLTVYRNSVYMIEGIDYEVQGNKIVSLKGNWNAEGGSDYKFTFEVLKAVAKVNPDAVVGMEHLTEDVKEAIEAAGNVDLSGYATKEELNNIDMSGKQDKTDNGLVTTDKTIVGAINELFQSANNGKELIANAIGEPVSAEDTFSAMSNDINGLLATFKTNMMNNGITVESSDKFKSLIDKIATMVEEGSGKGIQYASGSTSESTGTKTFTRLNNNSTVSRGYYRINLEFKPILLYTYQKYNYYDREYHDYGIYDTMNIDTVYTVTCNYTDGTVYSMGNTVFFKNIEIIDNYIELPMQINDTNTVMQDFYWYAIGVGEEDTTLRDSLASILQEEGVSVTEEDDMASLINKVDEEFDRQVVPAGNVTSDKVVEGNTFMNSSGELLTGTMVNHPVNTNFMSVNAYNDGKLYVRIPFGAYLTPGSAGYPIIVVEDENFRSDNIVNGTTIMGVTGTADSGSKIYSGTASNFKSPNSSFLFWETYNITYSDIGFTPSIIVLNAKAIETEHNYVVTVNSSIHNNTSNYAVLGDDTSSNYGGSFVRFYINNITSTGFNLNIFRGGSEIRNITNISYYAISGI